MAGRPGVRGGRATRGFPPGSAQALVAVVLGVVLAVAGLRRGEPVLAAFFLVVAAFGVLSLVRLLRRTRGHGDRPDREEGKIPGQGEGSGS